MSKTRNLPWYFRHLQSFCTLVICNLLNNYDYHFCLLLVTVVSFCSLQAVIVWSWWRSLGGRFNTRSSSEIRVFFFSVGPAVQLQAKLKRRYALCSHAVLSLSLSLSDWVWVCQFIQHHEHVNIVRHRVHLTRPTYFSICPVFQTQRVFKDIVQIALDQTSVVLIGCPDTRKQWDLWMLILRMSRLQRKQWHLWILIGCLDSKESNGTREYW